MNNTKRHFDQSDDLSLDCAMYNVDYTHCLVKFKRGKYKGKFARVLKRCSKKYSVAIDGVKYVLEFYPDMFELVHPDIVRKAYMHLLNSGTCTNKSSILSLCEDDLAQENN